MSGRSTQRNATHLVHGAGEALCLDFANTVAWRGTEAPEERLPEARDLLAWYANASALPSETVGLIRQRWNDRPTEAHACHCEALALREAIDRICRAAIASQGPADADLRVLNAALAMAVARERVGAATKGFGWLATSDQSALSMILAPIAWSAADLLTGPRLGQLRACASTRCAWLFLDASRGGTRRWCSMRECGNQAKARRHYLRGRAGSAADEPG
jgi:predicted RNA-binding Zn ribbon-like protein